MFISQTGIILQKIPYSEADEIITVLLKEQGVHRFFAHGSRKSKKKFQGLLDHFAHLHFEYQISNKGLWTLRDVQRLAHESQSVLSLEAYAVLSYLAELITEFVPEGGGDHGLYDLWLELQAEVKLRTPTDQLANKYLTRFFARVGYALHSPMPLKEMTHFSERILQKKSRAAEFFLRTLTPTRSMCSRSS